MLEKLDVKLIFKLEALKRCTIFPLLRNHSSGTSLFDLIFFDKSKRISVILIYIDKIYVSTSPKNYLYFVIHSCDLKYCKKIK
ncbi:hypothetical protein V1478_012021 [Vespula squamosa]|uniref:Uncharacterized protein n=1 Tax=Vespula squamosa TaxID=30214 RepID=A0ABD2AEN6_VESSQ